MKTNSVGCILLPIHGRYNICRKGISIIYNLQSSPAMLNAGVVLGLLSRKEQKL